MPATKGGAGGSGGERHREVERADDSPDSMGTHHVRCDLGWGETPHGNDEAIMLLHLVAVVPDEIGGLLDVTERLETVLADLIGHHGGQDVAPLADQISGTTQDVDSFLPWGGTPSWREPLGTGNRIFDIARRPLGETAGDHIVIDGGADLPCSIAGARPPVDEEWVLQAEEIPGSGDAVLVGDVEIVVVRGERGVGDAEFLVGHQNPFMKSRTTGES